MRDPLRPGTVWKSLVVALAVAFACVIGLAIVMSAVHR